MLKFLQIELKKTVRKVSHLMKGSIVLETKKGFNIAQGRTKTPLFGLTHIEIG